MINNIMRKLQCTTPSPQRSYIYRVHHRLRNENHKAYDPVLISIGPYHYHRREKDLQYMEKHKFWYLNELIRRKEDQEGVSKDQLISKCFGVLEALEDLARGSYADIVTLGKDDFLEMMLLDSCFIIEYFQRSTWENLSQEREVDPLFNADWMRISLDRDLVLVENQIPYFVIEELYSVIGDNPGPICLIFMAVRSLSIYSHLCRIQGRHEWRVALQGINNLVEGGIVRNSEAESRRLNGENLKHIKHLLDLVRKFMLIEDTLEINGETIQEAQQVKIEEEEAKDTQKQIHSASELREFGVRFKGVTKGKFYDIKFENGLLEIPMIKIEDRTEDKFRNLIAYEEHACCDDIVRVKDYMSFMDGLINSSKDVQLLRRQGIINSLVGDDEAIASMFNKMCNNVVLSSKFRYAKVLRDLAEHCRKRRHAWMAKLKRNYLNTPWTILSVIAASLLLILTIMQTIYHSTMHNNSTIHVLAWNLLSL